MLENKVLARGLRNYMCKKYDEELFLYYYYILLLHTCILINVIILLFECIEALKQGGPFYPIIYRE